MTTNKQIRESNGKDLLREIRLRGHIEISMLGDSTYHTEGQYSVGGPLGEEPNEPTTVATPALLMVW